MDFPECAAGIPEVTPRFGKGAIALASLGISETQIASLKIYSVPSEG